jgi:hypothetical protein
VPPDTKRCSTGSPFPGRPTSSIPPAETVEVDH